MKRVILTSGGTAGHVWPIVSIIDELKQNSDIEYLYVGSNGIEKKIAKEQKLNFQSILVGKYRPYFSLMNLVDFFKTFIGLFQALKLIKKFKPDLIFAKGGFVTFPLLFWAKQKNIPVIIHESDSIMGKANVWAANFAQKICVGFPLENYNERNQKYIYTGNPVRKEFTIHEVTDKKLPTILITGGSQGSRAINDTISEILPLLVKRFEIYHLCGQKDFCKLKQKFNLKNYHLSSFDSRIDLLMQKADLIISRSGANTLAEIAALEKASILIPYPFASQNHQFCNAEIFVNAHAAIMIDEKSLTSNALLDMIESLMSNEEQRSALSRNIGKFYNPNAASEMVIQIKKVLNYE